MKKLLALVALVVATLVVTFVPEARAQVRRGSKLFFGSSTTTIVLDGPVEVTSTATKTSCTLNGASPAVCTATVTAGSKCFCALVGGTAAIAAMNCAIDISSTTATVTAANAANAVVNILCL